MPRILVVDDEPVVLNSLLSALSRSGYYVSTANRGSLALEMLAKSPPDLVVLDLQLPDMDGLEVCRRIREQSMVPILMLAVRGEELDRVLGLDSGADDYLTKPFSFGELLARVRAVLRRAEMKAVATGDTIPRVLRAGPLEIDMAARKARLGETELKLSPKEFGLLAMLMRHAGTVVTREQLLSDVWGSDKDIDPKTLAVHVGWLRQKIGTCPSSPQLIETVRGVGYRLVG